MKKGLSACCLLLLCLTLAACTPRNAAVGDTQTTATAIDHGSMDKSDITVGLVGSDDMDLDKGLLDACAREGIRTIYVSTYNVSDSTRAAFQGVKDLTRQAVTVIVVSRLRIGSAGQPWNHVLTRTRQAGIPLVLVNAQEQPKDTTLVAVAMMVDKDVDRALPFDHALELVVNDRPHPRKLMVTTK